jgi:hypothetical protein
LVVPFLVALVPALLTNYLAVVVVLMSVNPMICMLNNLNSILPIAANLTWPIWLDASKALRLKAFILSLV